MWISDFGFQTLKIRNLECGFRISNNRNPKSEIHIPKSNQILAIASVAFSVTGSASIIGASSFGGSSTNKFRLFKK
jgi:hypothetical protein